MCSHRGRNGFSPHKKVFCSITQLLSRPISQEPFLYVRTLSSTTLSTLEKLVGVVANPRRTHDRNLALFPAGWIYAVWRSCWPDLLQTTSQGDTLLVCRESISTITRQPVAESILTGVATTHCQRSQVIVVELHCKSYYDDASGHSDLDKIISQGNSHSSCNFYNLTLQITRVRKKKFTFCSFVHASLFFLLVRLYACLGEFSLPRTRLGFFEEQNHLPFLHLKQQSTIFTNTPHCAQPHLHSTLQLRTACLALQQCEIELCWSSRKHKLCSDSCPEQSRLEDVSPRTCTCLCPCSTTMLGTCNPTKHAGEQQKAFRCLAHSLQLSRTAPPPAHDDRVAKKSQVYEAKSEELFVPCVVFDVKLSIFGGVFEELFLQTREYHTHADEICGSILISSDWNNQQSRKSHDQLECLLCWFSTNMPVQWTPVHRPAPPRWSTTQEVSHAHSLQCEQRSWADDRKWQSLETETHPDSRYELVAIEPAVRGRGRSITHSDGVVHLCLIFIQPLQHKRTVSGFAWHTKKFHTTKRTLIIGLSCLYFLLHSEILLPSDGGKQ